MTKTIHRLIELPTEYASQVVARYVWQLDDQTRRLFEPSLSLTPEALQWQPGPGHNTMGMLFAHVAIAEAHMAAVLVEGRADSDVRGVLGIGPDDDGLPLPPDGLPPSGLANRSIEWYRDLVDRARVETKRVARGLTDADLDRRVTRHPEDGSTRIYNVDWSLYHIVEHLAGHRAQIHQLQHLYEQYADA